MNAQGSNSKVAPGGPVIAVGFEMCRSLFSVGHGIE
jgi:hypothetical protein